MIDLIVRGLAIDGQAQVLSVKHIGKDYWCLPGGKVEDGEELAAAMKREVIEELGVEPKIGRLLHVYQFFMNNDQAQRLEFIFEITNPQDYTHTDFTKTTHGMDELEQVDWLDLSETGNFLPPFIVSYVSKPPGQRSQTTELHITR